MKTHPQFLAKMQRREKSFFEKDILFPEFCSFFDIVKKDKKGKGMKGFSKTGHLKNLIKFEKKNHFFGKCSISKNIRFFFLLFTPNPSITPKNGMSFQNLHNSFFLLIITQNGSF